MPFGYLLHRLRVEKGLSQRKLGQLAGVDNAYIDRLEDRSKESPSEEIARKLAGALSLADREAWLLGFVARYREYVDVGMIEYMLDHPAILSQEFSWAVAVKFRAPQKLDYPTLFNCARQVLELVDCYVSEDHSRFRSRRA